MPPILRQSSSAEEQAGIVPSHGIALDIPEESNEARPPNIRHVSSPAYESPLRHHHRKPSTPRQVKETLHARSEYTNSEDDGAAIHRINQYMIKQEIGRGSFGAVHLAIDQNGTEYAVKEFSKSRLRKRAQSNILRRPHGGPKPGHLAAGGVNSPLHRHSASDIYDNEGGGNSLYLIKEEIAIMKKLNHDNLVSLIEVLDDPNEDSLYMVLEMCKKGVVMKVGVNEKAEPYDAESCRCWFRDLILGIEYLHAQGVVHRDIKPDNLLLTDRDVLKIVDFGVSEMFEKASEMLTVKSAGSPAFLPPELCVSKHGGISGKAADIWSMGVTLYCLRFGHIPFEKPGVLELYECIQNDTFVFDSDCEEDFKDLMLKILEKDASKRIHMKDLRAHPWVTKRGSDPLLSAEENTADLVEPPTEEEMNRAITGNMSNLIVVMKAVRKFKSLLGKRRPYLLESILGRDTRMVQPPLSIQSPSSRPPHQKSRSVDLHDRRALEGGLATEGVHRDFNSGWMDQVQPIGGDASAKISPVKRKIGSHERSNTDSRGASKRDIKANPEAHRSWTTGSHEVKRGQARDPLEEHLFLDIGPGGEKSSDTPAVSESPPAADIDIYETAYHDEIERLREKQGRRASLFLTRRVEHSEEFQRDEDLIGRERAESSIPSGLAKLVHKVRDKEGDHHGHDQITHDNNKG